MVNGFISDLNNLLFHDYVVFALLGTGVLFTAWSVFGQYRALTHGTQVTRGKYDDPDDPGAINHFQALSAALSATVGLGNIGGVAVAVALGGPGAIFWMWVIGVVGMALKMTEVTQSMIFRNTHDPDNPHGGPMFVVKKGLAAEGAGVLGMLAGILFAVVIAGLGVLSGNPIVMAVTGAVALVVLVLGFTARAVLGSAIGGLFCVTLLISAITGGNMFQSFNVAEVTHQYFPTAPKPAIGVLLAIIVGLVIIGGIKRIGAVAGRLVPAMCALYLLAGVVVLALFIGDIPGLLVMIVRHGIGLDQASPSGAFLGGAFGYAAIWGIKRALFSSEAGQGSSPIAHSAAKCDEPVREGVVAGLEPFIDTIVVCTMTALIILSTGAWNRDAEANFTVTDNVRFVQDTVEEGEAQTWTLNTPALPSKTDNAKRISQVPAADSGWTEGDQIFMLVTGADNEDTGANLYQITGTVAGQADGTFTVEWDKFSAETEPALVSGDVFVTYIGAGLTAHAFDRAIPGLGMWLIILASWLFAVSTMISWSYYGEQGVVYLFGDKPFVILLYKFVYCLLIFASTLPFIRTEAELDMWTTLGLGAMLVANIPIMLIFGAMAMKSYHSYIGKLKRGEFHAHAAPPIEDVVEGKDVE